MGYQNSSLKPITSLHQVLYSNTGPGLGQMPPHPRDNYPRRTEVGLQTEHLSAVSQVAPHAAPAGHQPGYLAAQQGYGSGAQQNYATDKYFLERNLEKLVAEQGVGGVIGELTNQMSPQQLEVLVRAMKEKLASPDSRGSRQPIDLATIGEISLDKFLSQLSLHQMNNLADNNNLQPQQIQQQQQQVQQPPTLPMKQSKKQRSASGSGALVSSMPDLSDCHKSDTSSDDVQRGAQARSPRHKPRKSNLSGKQKSKTDLSQAEGGTGSVNKVRFDPAQVPERSPHSGRHERESSERHRRHRSSRHHRHRDRHHRERSSSRSRGQVPEVSRTGSLPRSHSYSGRTGLAEIYSNGRVMEDDERSECSTCSSSSSDSDDPYAYQLPPRRAYGGVRISYVPNDRFALSHRDHRHLSGRRSLRTFTPGPELSAAPPGPGAQVRGHHLTHPPPELHLGQAGGRRDTMSQDRDKDKCIIS